MPLRALSDEQIQCRALQLGGGREQAAALLVFRRELDEPIPHRQPTLDEIRRADLLAALHCPRQWPADILDLADAAAALDRDGDREIPNVVGKVFEERHRYSSTAFNSPGSGCARGRLCGPPGPMPH